MKYSVSEAAYGNLVTNVKRYFSEADRSIWERRNRIKVIFFLEKEITVKSFKVPHFINKIAYTFFRHSKAEKSYENSMHIGEFVPKPIGYAEFKKFGLLHESYFLSERFEYDFTIREPLTQENFEEREKIFQLFAEFTHRLHEEGIEHLDYSPGNILIQRKGDKYLFKIVDVNRMRFGVLTLEERLKSFSKLWAKKRDLEIIIERYAILVGEESGNCIEIAEKYSQRHKDRKNFKKRLKGKKVVD